MAHKPSPNSLIHCAECGEDYSATYKKCPFCGAKNVSQQSASERQEPSGDLEDTYVFDGQELFDREEDGDNAPANSKGGKRLAEKSSSNPFANADINWPRVITFICSLVIIVAAMIIVFTVIYPRLSDTANSTPTPTFSATDPGSSTTEDPGPDSTGSGTEPTDSPDVDPTPDVTQPAPTGLTSVSFSRGEKDADFTLSPGESHTITLVFNPASWSGDVTWSSTDTTVATVSNGKVTNVNTSGKLRSAVITVTAGGFTLESKVYCKSAATAEPPASNPPASAPPASNPPASAPPASAPPTSEPPTTQAPSSGITVGKKGTIVNVPTGVYVRSSPSTTAGDNRIASLFNGTPITVLEDAGNGWYKISFSGVGGVTTEGYIKGDYISTD